MIVLVVVTVHLSMLLPFYGEVVFDRIMWKLGKDDKPVSTWVVRPILFLIGGFIAWKLGDVELWRVIIVMFSGFLAFFNPVIGLVLKQGMCHLGDHWWDQQIKRIPCMFRLWLFVWLYIVALTIYYYNDWYGFTST